MKKLTLKSILAGLSLFTIVACGNKKEESNTIRIGVMSGPEHVIAETAKQVAKEKYNLDVELVTFNDYIVPNEALNQGDLDANAYQTKPFMDEQIAMLKLLKKKEKL